jgi:hypothetical protein
MDDQHKKDALADSADEQTDEAKKAAGEAHVAASEAHDMKAANDAKKGI